MSAAMTSKTLACALLLGLQEHLITALLPRRARELGEVTPGLFPADDTTEWTYRRTNNDGKEPLSPSDWYLGFPDCGGSSQSPINLAADVVSLAKKKPKFGLKFYGRECTSKQLSFIADESTWKVDVSECDNAPQLSFEGDMYTLLQLHIHSPSEHLIGGSQHDAEIHFVHTRDGSEADILVVGIFLDSNEYGYNTALQPLWDVLDSGASTTDAEFATNAYNLLPANPAYSHYTGSLTTPPCTEGVKWVVMDTPTVIGRMQLEEFRTSVAIAENSKVDERSNSNRPAQPINGREVYFV